jgi:LL-diaminopimelate aminotransferase
MVRRNQHIAKLTSGYLFPEIGKRVALLRKTQPDAKIISLGIGDTTEPIPQYIANRMQTAAHDLSTDKYSGYGPMQGDEGLRQLIAQRMYNNTISAADIFISDGAKCDVGRLQVLFGSDVTIAVQDPSYPVYVDSSVIIGQTGYYQQGLYKNIVYLPCLPENDFFPMLKDLPHIDLIYFCSPNNPTGAVASREQLTELVSFAKKNRSIIIFDSAYAAYIRDPSLPKSIFEIPGAREVAIEINSFSKLAGFTGVRLGWSVVPKELLFDDGSSVHSDWSRIMATLFNGASKISQEGGIACLEETGFIQLQERISFYLDNARIIAQGLRAIGCKVYGDGRMPFIWAYFGQRDSWEIFDQILHQSHVVTVPGSGFGATGQGFMRFSAFGHRHHIEEAVQRLKISPIVT